MRVIDIHAHFGKWFLPIEKYSSEDILEMMDKNGIEKIVLSSTQALVYNFQEGNKELAKVIKAQSSFFGYLFLNPNYINESLKEMEKYLENKKFVGLGELYADGYIDQPLNCLGHKKILERLSKKYPEKIVLFHSWGEPHILQLAEMAKEFPEVNMIAGHIGGPIWVKATQILKKFKNVYLDVSAGCPSRCKIEDVVKEAGAERILFGSDLSLMHPAFTLGRINDAQISKREKEMILFGNAHRLFDWK